MTDQLTDSTLLERLRRIDPLDPHELPTPADTEATLGGLLRRGPGSNRPLGRSPRRLGRPRILIGGTTAAAMLAVALALLLGTSATPPAFAVTDHHDGTVTVKLLKLSGITGANRRLAAMGVRARIIPAAELAPAVAGLNPCVDGPPKGARTISFNPHRIPRNRVLLMTADRRAHLTSVWGRVKAMKLSHLPSSKRARALVQQARRLAKSGVRHVTPLPAVTVIGARVKVTSSRAVAANTIVHIVCSHVHPDRKAR